MGFWEIIGLIIAGLIIGLLARLVMPGKQNLNIFVTIIIGILGSLGGAWLWRNVFGGGDTDGIDWIAFLLGIGVAIVLIVIYGAIFGKKK
jgi:uncharacterized membrane protein YeaQ/YmgE (transglycosylase-associated protein family)